VIFSSGSARLPAGWISGALLGAEGRTQTTEGREVRATEAAADRPGTRAALGRRYQRADPGRNARAFAKARRKRTQAAQRVSIASFGCRPLGHKHVMARACGPPSGSRMERRQFHARAPMPRLDREEGADIQNKHVMARACGPPSGSRMEPRQFHARAPMPRFDRDQGADIQTNMSWPAHAGHPVGLARSDDSFMLAHQCPT